MMEWLRGWLLSILTVSLLCALAEALMPEGAVRRVGRLACGLALLWGVLWPCTRFRFVPGDRAETWRQELEKEGSAMEERLNTDMKRIIEERCGAYIQSKGEQRGRSWSVRVFCRSEDGLFLPDRAEIPGGLSAEEQEEISRLLETDLGIPPERQVCTGREEGT